MAAFEAWLVFLILVVNVVGELQRKRTLAASRGFLAAARLSCYFRSTSVFSALEVFYENALYKFTFDIWHYFVADDRWCNAQFVHARLHPWN